MTENFSNDERQRQIQERVARIREEIAGEAVRCGRKPEDITLMAVTKTVDPIYVNTAIGCGVRVLGENRVQEYLSKRDDYRLDGCSVHMIGHLQSNKVKFIVDKVDCIQSVDSVKLLSEIDKESAKAGKKMKILCEVNIGREESKSGLDPDAVVDFVEQAAGFSHIQVSGLMAIPPICDKISDLEDYFDRMYNLFLDISTKKIDNVSMDLLSMGMSGDYLPAIRHGSNMVRLGTAIFGRRNY
ncbi:YggS family pyridoxal phosphate-dependent enzyme [Zongyangia hominis]|uniref:Pyridoxal phosphate homeostasis protein n=1 Tax=Zongyangia hominis TaxID=2763677 RepID=A0A926ED97_9FIRM|nr:YggS family pyridoxal phosphate-dependent enzyme [Zongyangia hominis]MBC8569637.1 YggS family pyridoxal phosphate-dependent enzyme [Zongyangia hominis]